MIKLFQLFALLTLLSCRLGNAPLMERKVKIWNGAPEEVGICRMSTANLAYELEAYHPFLKQFHKGTTRYECINANQEQFKQYACLTFEDLGVLYEYIETLIFECKKW